MLMWLGALVGRIKDGGFAVRTTKEVGLASASIELEELDLETVGDGRLLPLRTAILVFDSRAVCVDRWDVTRLGDLIFCAFLARSA